MWCATHTRGRSWLNVDDPMAHRTLVLESIDRQGLDKPLELKVFLTRF